jgi:hypothetical protein
VATLVACRWSCSYSAQWGGPEGKLVRDVRYRTRERAVSSEGSHRDAGPPPSSGLASPSLPQRAHTRYRPPSSVTRLCHLCQPTRQSRDFTMSSVWAMFGIEVHSNSDAPVTTAARHQRSPRDQRRREHPCQHPHRHQVRQPTIRLRLPPTSSRHTPKLHCCHLN